MYVCICVCYISQSQVIDTHSSADSFVQ